jgi:hypothetical protein
LEKILDKHGVPDCEKKRLIEAHSKWYGEPIYRVLARLQESHLTHGLIQSIS